MLTQYLQTLAREIRIWAELKHANVLPLWGFIAEGENAMPSLISEWMFKGALFKFMKTFPKSSDKTCKLLHGISKGLAYLHSERVIHADLKSQNILISQNGEPQLTDFGLSLALMHSQTALHRSSNSGKGTIRWMAKELIDVGADGASVGHNEKTDIWAFGMVVYEMLSWKVPYWKFRHDAGVMFQISKGELPEKPTNDSGSNIFIELWDICESCWSPRSLRPSAKQVSYWLLELIGRNG
ncbi:kinase-like protein [Schizopora paradoxa]|uniref:Kinase-like protein n=1 Tax=Schizopora paradoxa TaxID=27342 RepID=A0A0H2RRT1_9AGAM|nr:kinase-like protein [Schizopora paradoxa]